MGRASGDLLRMTGSIHHMDLFDEQIIITPTISRHTCGTHFKICTKYESKRIIKKFKVLIAVGTKKVLQSADYRFYTVLTNTEVSHPQSQGTHVEHTSRYVQSMDHKELSRNSRY